MDVICFLYISLGSSTVQLYDSLGRRCACACSGAGFSGSKWRPCLRSILPKSSVLLCVFLWTKGLNAKDIHKEILFGVGSVCRVKRFTTGSRNSLRDVRKSQMIPDQLQKWLRQQSKDLYAIGFDALVKRWDKCINVVYAFVTYLLTLPRILSEVYSK
jgi:hypothetical protein